MGKLLADDRIHERSGEMLEVKIVIIDEAVDSTCRPLGKAVFVDSLVYNQDFYYQKGFLSRQPRL